MPSCQSFWNPKSAVEGLRWGVTIGAGISILTVGTACLLTYYISPKAFTEQLWLWGVLFAEPVLVSAGLGAGLGHEKTGRCCPEPQLDIEPVPPSIQHNTSYSTFK